MGKDSDWKKETICLEAITLGIHNKQEWKIKHMSS